MDRSQMLWKMTAEQFVTFDVQLYLDTHPTDRTALQMFMNYQRSYAKCKAEFETMYGPITADSAAADTWKWVQNPWPWEKEAN